MAESTPRCPDCGSAAIGQFVPGLCPVCLMALAVKGGVAAGAGGLLVADADEPINRGDADSHSPSDRARMTATDAPWIGPYRVVRRIAEGGMGVVYEAEQERPISRTVALKVVRAGMDSDEVIARFTSERQALALMSHANIAKVFDAGTTADGRPFFAMEFVPGEPITKYCDRHRMSTRARLELFAQACDAVQHAHNKGIIHRDIKPSNVLVTRNDGHAVVKVIDFGIAKALSARLTEQTLYTEHGRLLGTPAYMSPEQLERGSLDVDTRADVYSLGVLLYELLSGSLPVDVSTSASATLSFGTLRRALLAGEPPSPSSRVSELESVERDRVAAARDTRWRELHRELRSELEWIPLNAIRAERAERYRSPSQLADDVNNYLAGRALIAGPRSRAYLVRKFVRNHRVSVGLASAAVAVILGLLVWLSIVTARAVRADALLTIETNHAKLNARLATANAERAEHARQEAERQLVTELVKFGDQLATSTPAEARESYLHALDTANELRIDEASILARLFAVRPGDVPLMGSYGTAGGVGGFPDTGHPSCVALLDDEHIAVTSGHANVLKFWDLRTGQLLRTWQTDHQGSITYVSASPDGKSLLSASYDHTVKLWDVRSGACKGTCKGHPGQVFVAVFAPDGKSAASGDTAGNIYTWNLADCSATNHWVAHPRRAVASIAYSRDGQRIASGGFDGKVRVWDASTGKMEQAWRTTNGVQSEINSVTWNADETAVFSGNFEGLVQRWDCQNPRDGITVNRQDSQIWRIALSPDGTRLAVGYKTAGVRLLDARTGQMLRDFEGQTGEVLGVGFLRDGHTVVAGGADSCLRVWSTAAVDRFAAPPDRGRVTCGATADDGLALLGTDDGLLLLCDATVGRVLRSMPTRGGPLTGVQFLPGGNQAVSCARDGWVKVWDLSTGRELKKLAATTTGPALGVSVTSGEAVIVQTGQGCVRWDLARDVSTRADDAEMVSLASSPMTGAILIVDRSGDARLTDLSVAGALPLSLPKQSGETTAAAMSSDGRTFGIVGGNQFWWCVMSADSTITAFGPFTSEVGEVASLAFLPDGHTAIVAGKEGGAEVWNLDQRRAVAQIARDDGPGIATLALAPDGRMALSIGADGIARVWDFARVGTEHSLAAKVAAARATLEREPHDPASLAAFADWYAFRGRVQWATDLLKTAGADASIAYLRQARMYALDGDWTSAAREYQNAAKAGEVSPLLAQLWASASPATTRSAVGSGAPTANSPK